MRAWAETDRRRAFDEPVDVDVDDDRCDRCGEVADLLATSAGFDGERCLDCARKTAGGEPIEL